MKALNGLNPRQLDALIARAQQALVTIEQRLKDVTRDKIQKLLDEAGLTLEELYPERRTSGTRSRAPRPVKYRDPSNPAFTWTGLGKRPNWLREQLAAGRPLDRFLVRERA